LKKGKSEEKGKGNTFGLSPRLFGRGKKGRGGAIAAVGKGKKKRREKRT